MDYDKTVEITRKELQDAERMLVDAAAEATKWGRADISEAIMSYAEGERVSFEARKADTN